MQKYLFIINPTGFNFIQNPQRNKEGRISTNFYQKIIILYTIANGMYNPKLFKDYISSLNILTESDKELMPTKNYQEWKHYIDAAKQELLDNKILFEKEGEFTFDNENFNIQLRKYIYFFEISATS